MLETVLSHLKIVSASQTGVGADYWQSPNEDDVHHMEFLSVKSQRPYRSSSPRPSRGHSRSPSHSLSRSPSRSSSGSNCSLKWVHACSGRVSQDNIPISGSFSVSAPTLWNYLTFRRIYDYYHLSPYNVFFKRRTLILYSFNALCGSILLCRFRIFKISSHNVLRD